MIIILQAHIGKVFSHFVPTCRSLSWVGSASRKNCCLSHLKNPEPYRLRSNMFKVIFHPSFQAKTYGFWTAEVLKLFEYTWNHCFLRGIPSNKMGESMKKTPIIISTMQIKHQISQNPLKFPQQLLHTYPIQIPIAIRFGYLFTPTGSKTSFFPGKQSLPKPPARPEVLESEGTPVWLRVLVT